MRDSSMLSYFITLKVNVSHIKKRKKEKKEEKLTKKKTFLTLDGL